MHASPFWPPSISWRLGRHLELALLAALHLAPLRGFVFSRLSLSLESGPGVALLRLSAPVLRWAHTCSPCVPLPLALGHLRPERRVKRCQFWARSCSNHGDFATQPWRHLRFAVRAAGARPPAAWNLSRCGVQHLAELLRCACAVRMDVGQVSCRIGCLQGVQHVKAPQHDRACDMSRHTQLPSELRAGASGTSQIEDSQADSEAKFAS